MKLNAYMGLEEEYEELKEKVKYDGGKFLDNERKENEIIILRKENSSLKKENKTWYVYPGKDTGYIKFRYVTVVYKPGK